MPSKINADGSVTDWSVDVTGSNAQVDGATTPPTQNMMYNGANWDRQRNNIAGTILASSARTASTIAPDQTNHNAKGVVVFLDVTAVGATGGLTVKIRAKDPVTGKGINLFVAGAAITAVGFYAYELYPGSNGAGLTGSFNVQSRLAGSLPRTWFVEVTHGDGTSYTYSVGYGLIV